MTPPLNYIRSSALFLLLAFTAQAAPLSPADRDAVRQQQEQLLRQSQQQRDELGRSTTLPRSGQSTSAPQAGGPCFDIHTITLSGVTLISEKAQQKLTAPWLNQCLNMAKITELAASISDWYISRGYITKPRFPHRTGFIARRITHCRAGREITSYPPGGRIAAHAENGFPRSGRENP
jgi:hemolysin activation/secretion protein